MMVALVILTSLMFLTASDITARFFGNAIDGAYQISEIMQVWIICFAWPFTTANFAHVRLEFFIQKFPSWLRHKIDILNNLIVVLIFGLISWQGIELVKRSRELHELIGIIEIPLFPFQVAISIGAFANFLVLLVQLGNLFTQTSRKEA